LDEKYITLPEYVETAGGKVSGDEEEDAPEVLDAEEVEKEESGEADGETKEEEPTTVYYVTDLVQQSQYINLFREQGMDALVLTHNIDQPFINQLEQSEDVKVRFQRIDSDVSDSMKEEGDEETLKAQTEELSALFQKALGKEQLEVQVQNLKNENISSMVTLSEETRRMQDMMRMYSSGGAGMDMSMFGGGETLILNANNKLVQYILDNQEGEHTEMFCKQLYDLAMLANKPLPAEEMTEFVSRSNEIMMLLAQ
jgi:molecular chaperone HtpG